MEQQWRAVRDEVFGQIQDVAGSTSLPSEKSVADLIVDCVVRVGIDMRHESSLEQMKSLLVDALRAAIWNRGRALKSPDGSVAPRAAPPSLNMAAVAD